MKPSTATPPSALAREIDSRYGEVSTLIGLATAHRTAGDPPKQPPTSNKPWQPWTKPECVSSTAPPAPNEPPSCDSWPERWGKSHSLSVIERST